MSTRDTDPLEPVLRDVEAKLRSRLREACEAEANGISSDDASEIRRVEDSLLAAAVAAEQTIELRRHIEDHKTERTVSDPPEPNAMRQSTLKIREFRDADGRLWRAWPVTPTNTRPNRAAERVLGEFLDGWTVFEAVESNARRRLPSHPERWTELKDADLRRLLGQAINVPDRKRRSEGEDGVPSPHED